MNGSSANWLLVIAWFFFVFSAFRLAHGEAGHFIPSMLWAMLVGALCGLPMYYYLWTTDDKKVEAQATPTQPASVVQSGVTNEGNIAIVQNSPNAIVSQALLKPKPNPDEWPALTDIQISAWISALKPDGNRRVSVQWYSADTDARAFYKSIRRVGEKLDWSMGGYEPMDGVDPGLTIGSRADDPAALTIRKLLKEYSGIEPKWSPANYDQGVINIKVGEKIVPPSSTPDHTGSPP